VLLNAGRRLRLVTRGEVVWSGARKAAMKITRYEFRNTQVDPFK